VVARPPQLSAALDGRKMNAPIGRYRDQQAWLITLEPSEAFASPFNAETFVCLVWANQQFEDALWRDRLSSALVAAGCRYAVCAGVDCETWHDAIDSAALAGHSSDAGRDNQFVMTTWHDGEPEEDVVEYFLNSTNFDGHLFSNYLVLVVGGDQALATRLMRLISSRGFAHHAV